MVIVLTLLPGPSDFGENTPAESTQPHAGSNTLAHVGIFVRQVVVDAVNKMIEVFTFFEVVITNLSSVWDLVVSYAELYMRKMAGIIMHILTVVIPAYAMWFADNFVNIFRDAFNAVITIISNAGKNIGDMMFEIFEFLASGGEGGVEGLMKNMGKAAARGLLDGFKSTIGKLPDIADRVISDKEKELLKRIDGIETDLNKQFDEKMKERKLNLKDTFGGRYNPVMESVTAKEGRLLTRGSQSSVPQMMQQLLGKFDKLLDKPGVREGNKDVVDAVRDRMGNVVNMVPQP